MRKSISDIYSKAFPKKGGEEYSAKELWLHFAGWIVLLVLLFFLSKYIFDKYHLH